MRRVDDHILHDMAVSIECALECYRIPITPSRKVDVLHKDIAASVRNRSQLFRSRDADPPIRNRFELPFPDHE